MKKDFRLFSLTAADPADNIFQSFTGPEIKDPAVPENNRTTAKISDLIGIRLTVPFRTLACVFALYRQTIRRLFDRPELPIIQPCRTAPQGLSSKKTEALENSTFDLSDLHLPAPTPRHGGAKPLQPKSPLVFPSTLIVPPIRTSMDKSYLPRIRHFLLAKPAADLQARTMPYADRFSSVSYGLHLSSRLKTA